LKSELNQFTSNATMTDPIPSIDLRLTPDWLKESETINRYADYEGDDSQYRQQRARRERRDDRTRRSSSPADRHRHGQTDRKQPPASRSIQAQQRPIENRASPSRGERPRSQRSDEKTATPEIEAAPVQIDFLPEERAFSKIVQQIKQGHVAYPLFGLARMFLERPERHRIRVRSLDNHVMIYQFGDSGPVAMDPVALERNAFSEKKDEYYQTLIIEKEPVKGNFSSVARCTLTGKLLGPTNYHAFQPALRSLYEQRFNRRMSFEDYRRTIEITNNPQVVEQWKEEARKAVTFKTKDDQNPITFENLAAVEQHFRTNYLPKLIRPCLAAELSGETARHLPDRGIIGAIRKARDRENRFPAQIAGALRHGLNQAGLHVFKHKKRILYISTVRPQLFDSNQASVSSNLSAILSAIRSYPKISRKQLAEKVLSKLGGPVSPDESTTEYQHAKTALATDLIWLAKAGHVIEFADGTLDLPLPPKLIESDKGSLTASRHGGRDPAKSETAASHSSVSVADEFEGGAEEETIRATEGLGTANEDQIADPQGHSGDPAESNLETEAQGEPGSSTGDHRDVTSRPSELRLEKDDEDECATASSSSRLV
jgi:hypothetical protein